MNIIDPLTWSVLLMVVGCALIVLEVFIPSGGILGFLASMSVLASVALAFYHRGPAVGFTFTLFAVLAMPLSVILAFKYWPHTPMGKRFLLGLPSEDEIIPDDRHQRLKSLIGKRGTAQTPMLPSGAVRVEGQTIDAVSEGSPIEPGQKIEVIEVRAYRVVVRPVEGQTSESPPQAEPDVLDKSLEELGIEPLDDPLA